MANTLLTPDMIIREVMFIVENNLQFARHVRRDLDSQFAQTGAKIGDRVSVRVPARFTVTDSNVLNVQDYTERSVTVIVNHQLHVGVQFTMKDLTLTMDDFSKRVLAPQVAELANEIDRLGLLLYKDVYNFVGVPAVVPNALETYLNAGALLHEEAVPMNPRYVIIGPRMQVKIVDALKGLFESSPQLRRQYEDGTMGRAAGMDWEMDQNVATHTVGVLGGTPLVNGASQTGATLITDGWTSAAATRLKAGDIIQISGVYAINPKSRVSTAQLRNFVVTADTASDASGNMTIPIDPPITPPVGGLPVAYQTVDSSPANNAPITIFGHASSYASLQTPQGLLFHPEAFCLVSVDLEDPRDIGAWGSRISSKQLGLSLRIVKQYNIDNDTSVCRVDALIGWKTLRPELAVRIVS